MQNSVLWTGSIADISGSKVVRVRLSTAAVMGEEVSSAAMARLVIVCNELSPTLLKMMLCITLKVFSPTNGRLSAINSNSITPT